MATGHERHKVGKSSNDHKDQTKWSVVIKHIYWVNNHPMIKTAKYGSDHFTGYGEKFNHFPIISLWDISAAMATKPRGRSPILPSNILTKLGTNRFNGFGGVVV